MLTSPPVSVVSSVPSEDASDVVADREAPTKLSVGWSELGLAAGRRMAVRDVGNRRDLPDAVGEFGSVVAKHDVAFVRLTPAA